EARFLQIKNRPVSGLSGNPKSHPRVGEAPERVLREFQDNESTVIVRPFIADKILERAPNAAMNVRCRLLSRGVHNFGKTIDAELLIERIFSFTDAICVDHDHRSLFDLRDLTMKRQIREQSNRRVSAS